MPEIVGIRFKRAGKVYYFDPIGVELKVYDYVVVQTARGVELGQVIIAPKQVLASEITAELKPIVRKASEEDIKRAQSFTAKENSALVECAKSITRLKLPMKLVSAEYNLDGSRLTFYFTAEDRVDFRELVRELTGFFKTRIELRQIGPRDQAKLIGGLGRCGRALCCGSFLTEFSPVSIKMAKEQDLPLDPMKISGVCGRLQCCLSYESIQYHEAKSALPKKGQSVSTPAGNGIVTGIYPLKDSVLVTLETQAEVEVPASQVKILAEPVRIAAEKPPETEEAEPAAVSPEVPVPGAEPSSDQASPSEKPPESTEVARIESQETKSAETKESSPAIELVPEPAPEVSEPAAKPSEVIPEEAKPPINQTPEGQPNVVAEETPVKPEAPEAGPQNPPDSSQQNENKGP